MRRSLVSVIVAALGMAGAAAYADSVTSTSGGGVNVSIVTGNNGGTTIVVNSDKPCRTENRTASNKTESSGGSGGQSLNMSAGSMSGSTQIGPSGQMSVNINPGSGGSSVVTSSSGGTVENKTVSGECVIIIQK